MSEKLKRDLYQEVTDKILAKLESGVIPWHCPWVRTGSHPMNAVSKTAYRGINALLTGMSGYPSPYWLTFKQARDLGGCVRKGEKGTPVVYWSVFEKESTNPDKPDRFGFIKHYTVFNVSQVDGLPEGFGAVSDVKVSEFTPIESASQIADGMPCKPRLQHIEQRAFYSTSMDYVNMPIPESFASAEEYYSTLFHELTHSTGHESRLARKTLKDIAAFGDHSYSKEELVAEMGSAYLCAVSGISDPVIGNQAAYIGNWIKRLKSDPKMLIQAAGQAQKATDYILGVTKEESES